MDMFNRMLCLLLLCATAAGCANVNTLARSSSIPTQRGGKAIHLDAQQRLVVFTAMKYCAEPSPDALAAYAAALGFSGSKLPGDSLSASGALNSVAGSIGLRTQSITLMRDTLYRNCEAALNGYLGPEQMAVLMSRSQDLTAVILAIEQLTGAVAAPPVTLNTGGSSSSASTLAANTEALKAAEEQLARTKKARDEAEPNPQIEENQRALSVVCLRYFAQFRPHYGPGSDADAETPPGASGTTSVQPPRSTANSFDAYRDETARQAKAIIDQANQPLPNKPKE